MSAMTCENAGLRLCPRAHIYIYIYILESSGALRAPLILLYSETLGRLQCGLDFCQLNEASNSRVYTHVIYIQPIKQILKSRQSHQQLVPNPIRRAFCERRGFQEAILKNVRFQNEATWLTNWLNTKGNKFKNHSRKMLGRDQSLKFIFVWTLLRDWKMAARQFHRNSFQKENVISVMCSG